jgi:hypothetical protein
LFAQANPKLTFYVTAIAARGAVKIVYYDTGNQDLNGNVCFIPNRTKLLCAINGATYTVLFGADTA